MADLNTLLTKFLDGLWKGAVTLYGLVGETTAVQTVTELLACTGGAGTQDTTASLIPANSLVLGVTVYVKTILTGGAIATFGVGTAGDADAWGADTAVAVAAGSSNGIANFTVTTPIYYASATKVRLTANAGTFTTGTVRVCVHYLTLTAPTS